MRKVKRKTRKAISVIVTCVLAINSIFMFHCVLTKPSFNQLKFVDAALFEDSEEIKQLKKTPYKGKIKI